MGTLLRRPRRVDRSDARVRAHGPRRFHETGPANFATDPPTGGDEPIWPAPQPSAADDAHLQWPYWIILVVPWLMWGASVLLGYLKVCLICVPDGVALLP